MVVRDTLEQERDEAIRDKLNEVATVTALCEQMTGQRDAAEEARQKAEKEAARLLAEWGAMQAELAAAEVSDYSFGHLVAGWLGSD